MVDLRECVPLPPPVEVWRFTEDVDRLRHPPLVPVGLFVEHADTLIVN